MPLLKSKAENGGLTSVAKINTIYWPENFFRFSARAVSVPCVVFHSTIPCTVVLVLNKVGGYARFINDLFSFLRLLTPQKIHFFYKTFF